MSFCDNVTNPMDNVEFLKSMIELYAKQNSQTRKSGSYIYDSIIEHPESEAHEDKNLYVKNYKKYVESDTMQKLFTDVFKFSEDDAKKIYKELFISENPESKTMQMSTDEIIRTLEKNGCVSIMFLAQFQDMSVAQILKDVFSGHGFMGYHVYESRLGKPFSFPEDIVKLYINAGADTYEFSKLFRQKCEEQGITYMYKVVNPEKDEHSRADKMCIYSGLDDIEKYSSIVKEIRAQHPEFDYRAPAPIMGCMDGWIGVGADPDNFELARSYSDSRALLIENSLKAVLGNANKKKIQKMLNQNPEEIVNKLKAEINRRAGQYAITKHFVFDDVIVQALEQENSKGMDDFYRENRSNLFPAVIEENNCKGTFWEKIKSFILARKGRKNIKLSQSIGPMPEKQLTYEDEISEENQFRQSIHVDVEEIANPDMPMSQTEIEATQPSIGDVESKKEQPYDYDDDPDYGSDVWR